MKFVSARTYGLVTGIVFLLGALVHLWRLVAHMGIEIGGWEVPMWASFVGIAVAVLFALEGFGIARDMHST